MRVLMTGATGYLGKHLLAALLAAGHEVTALVRGGDPARLARALRPFALPAAQRRAPQLVVVHGDVSVPGCGVADVAVGDGHDALLHCAGLTRFEARLGEELDRHNVTGAREAWSLARRLRIPAFHHLSTAYVAGRAVGPFGARDLERRQDFNNPYEASKHAAERWLRAAAASEGRALVIHRPSIVVGGYPIGENNSVSTVYTFMKAVRFIRECCHRDAASGRQRFARLGFRMDGEDFHIPVRVAADPANTINLVAIDAVVAAVLAGLEGAGTGVKTLMLTGPDIPIAAMERAICGEMRLSGVRLVPADAFIAAPRNALEAHFERMTQVYAPYLFRTPCFVPDGPVRPVDPVALTRDYLRLSQSGETRRRAPTVGTLALDTLGINAPDDYFAALVAGGVGRDFLARHDYVAATIGFALHGSMPCDVLLRVQEGRARVLAASTTPDCRYELDSALFMRIVNGDTDLRSAFLAGKVGIRGNIELALKFGALLGQYYTRIDEHVIAELTA